jgi:ABC-type amino acid transport substrate-binding protein
VGTQVPNTPFAYLNTTSGKYEGIDVEIAQRIADSLNVTLVIRPMDIDPSLGSVMTGRIDMAISSIPITEVKEQVVNFTIPYLPATQAVLVKDSISIANIDGLNGTKVAAAQNTAGASWAVTNLVETERINEAYYSEYEGAAAGAIAVQTGQKDAFVIDAPEAYAYASVPANHLKVAFIIETNESYGICIQKNQLNFRNALNEVISGLKADGSLTGLLLKYKAIGLATPFQGFVVQDVTGTVNAGFTQITDLTIQMRLQAGSSNMNMDQVSIQYVSGTTNATLRFVAGMNETAGGAVAGTSYSANTTNTQAWSTGSHVVHQGDLISVTITGLTLSYSAAATVKIVPAYGSSSLASFVTPSYYSVEYVNLK